LVQQALCISVRHWRRSSILGRAERYTIDQHPNAVVVRMRQGLRALGVAAVSLGVLIASWWFGPYGPPLALRVEQVQGSPRKRPVFGWRVHVLDAQRNVCGLHFDLQRRDGVESLIAGLRRGLSLDVQSTV
jgi:hypothetical protein